MTKEEFENKLKGFEFMESQIKSGDLNPLEKQREMAVLNSLRQKVIDQYNYSDLDRLYDWLMDENRIK